MGKEKKKKKKLLFDPGFLADLVVGIGEVSEMTGVSQRQLRYWQEKGAVGTLNEKGNTTRRFDYYAIRKIRLIRNYMEVGGMSLDEASVEADAHLKPLRKAIQKQKIKDSGVAVLLPDAGNPDTDV